MRLRSAAVPSGGAVAAAAPAAGGAAAGGAAPAAKKEEKKEEPSEEEEVRTPGGEGRCTRSSTGRTGAGVRITAGPAFCPHVVGCELS